jgi:uncharacterized cupredoxin-like copper-binding protein
MKPVAAPAAGSPPPRGRGHFIGASLLAFSLVALSVVLMFPDAVRSSPSTIRLVAEEFRFTPKEVTIPTGDIAFAVTNQGEIEHNLAVEDPGGKRVVQIAIIEPGETKSITASLPAGTYVIYCTLPGHREAGMAATLRVRP